jgi:4-amino-4-deoxy-L-arabinose transferase-like glycosyltransferase
MLAKLTRTLKHLHWEALAVIAILLLAAYLRLVNVGHNPGWYTDEGTHLDIARHYRQGRIQYLAINQSVLLFAKLPLFELLVAGLLALLDDEYNGMTILRSFSGMLGVITVAVLYGVGRITQAGRPALGLLAAFLYAIYPPAVLYSRFGFSYNLLSPLALLSLAGLWHYLNAHQLDRRGLALAAVAIGLGTISDIWMINLIPPLGLIILWRRWPQTWSDLGWAIPLALLPFALYSLIAWLNAPHAFVFDAHYTFYLVTKLSPTAQLTTLLTNIRTLFSQDRWLLLGVVGLCWLRPIRLRWLAWVIFGFVFLNLGRTVALFSLSFYYLIPLLPWVGLGLASLILVGYHSLSDGWQRVSPGLAKSAWLQRSLILLYSSAVAIPLMGSLQQTLVQVQHGFHTDIAPFLLDPDDTQQAAAFINAHSQADDLIIASPGLAWLLQANVADFQMSAASTGQETVHLPANIPPDRFVFNPHYRQAKYVIVDNLWRNWAVLHIAGTAAMVAEVDAWPQVWQAGEITIYCQPGFCD